MKTPALKFASSAQSANQQPSPGQAPDSPDQGNFIPVQFQSQQQQQQALETSGAPSSGPSRQEIELAAYELYAGSGFEEGHSLEHWLEAERRLQSHPQSSLL